MMRNSRLKLWRMSLPVLICLLVGGGLFTFPAAQPTAAAGISISSGSGPNTRPAMGISPDNSRICVVWTTFGAGADAFVRIYNVASNTWSPDLSQAAFLVSRNAGADVRSTARCAIDATGRTHVVWTEAGGEPLRYSNLSPGADASNANNWTAPITIGAVADSQNPDVVSIFADAAGKVWLAYWSLDAGSVVYVKSFTNGVGWSGDERASDGTGKFPRIGVDNAGYVHVIYQGGGIRYTYRDRVSGAWTPSVQVPGSGDAVPQSGLAVNRTTGDVHVVYSAGSTDDTRQVRYVKKTGSTGTAFGGIQTLTGQANYVVPRIAWSPSGKLTMVADNRSSGTIDAAVSDTNGNWSGSSTVGTAPGEGWPWVVMDDAGNSYISWWQKDAGDSIQFLKIGNVTNPPPAPVCASPGTRFCDVPTTAFGYAQIEAFAAKGRTTGCATDASGTYYCPERSVTRAEMAAFIIRTVTGQTAAPAGPANPRFSDVPTTHPQYGFIEALVARGITTGCSATEYCPDRPVNRAEMAAFIIRAITGRTEAPSATTQTFADVPTTQTQYGFIEDLFRRQITTGCGDPNATPKLYCPNDNVTRAEMAVFLERAYPNQVSPSPSPSPIP